MLLKQVESILFVKHGFDLLFKLIVILGVDNAFLLYSILLDDDLGHVLPVHLLSDGLGKQELDYVFGIQPLYILQIVLR